MSDGLTLEKIRVSERLTTLETKVDGIETKIDTMYKCLVGNGDVGLRTKVELLAQKSKEQEESHNRVWTAVIGTVVAFVGKTFWEIFRGK